MFRFGELNVARVRRIICGDTSPSCRNARQTADLVSGLSASGRFQPLKKLDCIVAGDIGCYSLGDCRLGKPWTRWSAWAPASAWAWGSATPCPADEARRVVSVIGDSTFVHSGIPGLVEMVYNPPPGGHVV